jgi:hypothetical protein
MRIFVRLTLLLCALTVLSACGSADEPLVEQKDGEVSNVAMVPCALGEENDFTDTCTLQRLVGSQRTTIVLGRGDSGFRRFLMTADGRGLIAADGAESARVSIIGDAQVEVAVGDDRYRLPAAIKGDAPVSNETAPQ